VAESGGARSKAERPSRARTSKQLERQEKVFNLSVLEDKSYREISAELGIAMQTVVDDMRHEALRRADEIAARRDTELARGIAFYDRAVKKGMQLAEKSTEAFMQPLARGLDSAIKARERIDKLLGLDAPTRVDVAVQGLVEALTTIQDGDPLFPSDAEDAAATP
jgi:hypothetical protein